MRDEHSYGLLRMSPQSSDELSETLLSALS